MQVTFDLLDGAYAFAFQVSSSSLREDRFCDESTLNSERLLQRCTQVPSNFSRIRHLEYDRPSLASSQQKTTHLPWARVYLGTTTVAAQNRGARRPPLRQAGRLPPQGGGYNKFFVGALVLEFLCSHTVRGGNGSVSHLITLEDNLVREVKANWPQQAAALEDAVFFPEAPGSEGLAAGWTWFAFQEPFGPFFQGTVRVAIAVFGQLFIADHSIRPEIGDFGLELVFSGFDCFGDVQFKWRFP